MKMEHYLGFREVIPDQTLQEKWKEITFTLGTSQSTLQDIKVPERAGGYCYLDSSNYVTRNRFIYWRILHDQLELVEHSLDVSLVNCRVRYKFVDTPLLDGISIYETFNSVVILVITVSSVHKLTFIHPTKYKQVDLSDAVRNLQMQSIFNEATSQIAPELHMFQEIPNNGSSNSNVPHASASWLIPNQNQAYFSLAYNTGFILLLKLDTVTGTLQTTEIKPDYAIPRFLSGLANAFRGKSENQVPMSLIMHTIGNEIYLFSLCRGGDLRIWSCKKNQCLSVEDVVVDNRGDSQVAQNFLLRKSVSINSELILGTYLKFETRCEFSILKLVINDGIFKLNRICSLLTSDQNLVDFAFSSSSLWAAWRTSDFDTITVKYTHLPRSNTYSHTEWHSVILESPVDKEYITNDSTKDPRQIYVNNIFKPGQFSVIDIIRALNIYRRTNIVPLSISRHDLREKVCSAVEAEIQNEIMDYELLDEDYIEIVNRCWSKFYSCVVQYHVNSSRLVGLLLLPNVHGAVILKKSLFSVLRPMEVLEGFTYHKDNSNLLSRNIESLPADDFKCQELSKLIYLLALLEKQLPDDFKSTIESELYHLKSPEIIIEELLPEIMENNSEIIYKKLESIKDITSAMAMLLEILTYELNNPNKSSNNRNFTRATSFNFFFGSDLGISILSKSVSQIASLRFTICINVLLLQQIALISPEILDSQSIHIIRSSLVPRTVVLTQAYYVVKWICESNVSLSQTQSVLNSYEQRLATFHHFSDHLPIQRIDDRFSSMLEYFIYSSSNKFIHNLTNESNLDNESLAVWHNGMHSYITLILQLIWPISNDFIFPTWLLSTYQFTSIIEYVRLLSTWCEWNGASRKFLLGISYLEIGEPQKACDLFLKASNGISTDPYLMKMLMKSNVTLESNALVLYYLKVIELFEQHNEYDCITELAETAMAVADPDDVNLPTLHSIIFTHHLNLEHYTEAYHYLGTNPEASRRIDCLRQLIVTLFNKNKLRELLTFPYVEMYKDLERIIENRARSVSLLEHNYYDFLYAFHINKGNLRKAATVMYEQALRLKQETQNSEIVAKQVQCLLACINSLYLVNDKYKWIVRPSIDQNDEDADILKHQMTVHDNDISEHPFVRKVDVLELKDIKNEYLLTEAKLRLTKLQPDIDIPPSTDAEELIAILSNAHLYVLSLRICDNLGISKFPVFDNLTSQCIKLSQNDDSNAWTWLSQNETYDLVLSCRSASDAAWRILEYFTFKHELEPKTDLHKCIVQKLFYHGAFIPHWLQDSYKKRNAAELLRLMLRFGRLIEAAELAIDYMQALLGKGKEYFNFKTDVYQMGSMVYLPYNTIEVLLLELDCAKNTDEEYAEVHEKLKHTLSSYIEVVGRISETVTKSS